MYCCGRRVLVQMVHVLVELQERCVATMLSQDRLILTIFPENEENNLQNIDLNNSTTFAILLGKEYLLEVGYDCITRTNDDPIIFSPSLFRLQGENEIPCHDWVGMNFLTLNS